MFTMATRDITLIMFQILLYSSRVKASRAGADEKLQNKHVSRLQNKKQLGLESDLGTSS